MSTSSALKNYYTNNYFYQNTHSYHYPIWNEHTKTYNQAADNTNAVVANALELQKGELVLDAGCGVGGTTAWIAQRHAVAIIGITVVPSQIQRAQEHATMAKVAKRTAFRVIDYTKTPFVNNTFNKIYAIESVCHAKRKQEFIREVYRLLKPGGKLVVLDAFRTQKILTPTDQKVYQDFLDGFVLDNLASQKEFAKNMQEAGFANVRYEDQSKAVGKTLIYYYIVCTLAYPFVSFFEKIGLIKNSLGHIISARNSKYLIDNAVLTYGVFVGTK